MPGLWNYRENVKYFRPAFNPSIFTHIRGVRARKFVAFGSLHQEPREREMPLKRDTDLTAQWRDAIVCCSTTANHSTHISSLCQIPSQNWTTFWLFHLQELVWQCLTEKWHQTQNKILQCIPSHPILCKTVFWSIFPTKELSLHDAITFPTDTYCIPRANTHFASKKQLRK